MSMHPGSQSMAAPWVGQLGQAVAYYIPTPLSHLLSHTTSCSQVCMTSLLLCSSQAERSIGSHFTRLASSSMNSCISCCMHRSKRLVVQGGGHNSVQA